MSASILVVDDDRSFLVSLRALLEDEGGCRTRCAASGAEALELLDSRSDLRVVLSDLAMPGMDGLELLREVRVRAPHLPFIIMTAHGSVTTAVEAMRLGAFQYVTKPVDPDELLVLVGRALEQSAVETRLRELEARVDQDVLVGSSPAVEAIRTTIGGLAEVDSTVLIRGETGTGKELVARLIHRASRRADRPFVAVNCTAIPTGLLESELFGHEKGAFTGATAPRRGRIEEAEGGTLLLDEVGDMPAEIQPKLLRFLQERTLRRVGGNRDRTTDVRIMAATHGDLEAAIADGSFRQDLYYRINTVPVCLPPLRERPQDVPELCVHLMARIARRLSRRPVPVSDEALAALASHRFPGNVRELENLLERAVVLGIAAGRPHDPVGPEDLQLEADGPRHTVPDVPLDGGLAALQALLAEAEARLIRRALATWPTLPNREIAERLGTNRRILELRMKEHGITKREPATGE